MTNNALIVDDEVDLCRLMQITLKKMNIKADVAYNLSSARNLLSQNKYDFCLTDLKLPDGSGLDLVKEVNEQDKTMPIAVITAHGNMDLAIEALKYGAFDFVNKPLELPRLRQLVEQTLKVAQDNIDTHSAKTPQADPAQQLLDQRLIGHSLPIKHLKKTIIKLARSQAPVFLWGESGTGKEVVAKLIHDLSPRREGNFVPINCGAIPSDLMESEFFGHKKGSFTGANTDKKGLFQQADGGTLFLDEVADLPLSMQVKLLRAIQEKTVRAIGSNSEVPVDIRILSATHKNLEKLVSDGKFRQDLYYRINVIELKLPTLNEREGDIEELATFFMGEITKEWDLPDSLCLSKDAIKALSDIRYDGNVRQLRNILERAVTLADSHIIEPRHLGLSSSHVNMPVGKELSKGSIDKPVSSEHANTTQSHEVNLDSQHQLDDDNSQKVTSSHFLDKVDSNKVDNKVDHRVDNKYRSMNYGTDVKFTTGFSDSVLTLTGYTSKPNLSIELPLNNLPQHQNSTIHATNTIDTQNTKTIPDCGLESYLNEKEREIIILALNQTNWNKTKAAELLKTSFRSLRYRMQKLGINESEDAMHK